MDKEKMRAKIDQLLSGELNEDTEFPEVGYDLECSLLLLLYALNCPLHISYFLERGTKYMEELGVDPQWATTSLSTANDDQGSMPFHDFT